MGSGEADLCDGFFTATGRRKRTWRAIGASRFNRMGSASASGSGQLEAVNHFLRVAEKEKGSATQVRFCNVP